MGKQDHSVSQSQPCGAREPISRAAPEAAPSVSLTEAQIEVLEALYGLPGGFWRPLDFGGYDGSHHSGTATRLAARGLVQRSDRFGGSISGRRKTWRYAITEAGRWAFASLLMGRPKPIPPPMPKSSLLSAKPLNSPGAKANDVPLHRRTRRRHLANRTRSYPSL